MSKIAVLMSQSLLAQGIVSRLRRSVPPLEVDEVDSLLPEIYERLAAIQPTTLIVEAEALEDSPYCTMDGLFKQFPNLTVIEVGLESPRIQLIQSGQLDSSGFGDLLQILARVDSNSSGGLASAIR
jgi:hypothetical protein